MRALISPWRSATTKGLATSLGLRHRFLRKIPEMVKQGEQPDLILNWGCASLKGLNSKGRIVNPTTSVILASDKRQTFKYLQKAGIPTPEWTLDKEIAFKWLETNSVVCHTDARGHSANGIILISKGSKDLPDAQLFTRYFPKLSEGRVLVVRPNAVAPATMFMEKKRVKPDRFEEFGVDKPDHFIRTHNRGWIFAREVPRNEIACDLAISACRALSLDFAAVDVLIKGDDVRVGELNTAPGLEGASAAFMVENLRKFL